MIKQYLPNIFTKQELVDAIKYKIGSDLFESKKQEKLQEFVDKKIAEIKSKGQEINEEGIEIYAERIVKKLDKKFEVSYQKLLEKLSTDKETLEKIKPDLDKAEFYSKPVYQSMVKVLEIENYKFAEINADGLGLAVRKLTPEEVLEKLQGTQIDKAFITQFRQEHNILTKEDKTKQEFEELLPEF